MKSRKVYFVHGLFGYPREYSKMRKKLEDAGFETEFFKYNSRKEDILPVGKLLYHKIKSEKDKEISIVAHSMGGLIVRAMFEHVKNADSFPEISRIVMIATPNQGAVFADFLYSKSIFRFIMGVNLKHFLNHEKSLSRTLPIPDTEIGIIAGYSGYKRGYNPFIGADNDLEVTPDETKIGTEKDFALVRSNHISILRHKKTHRYVLSFLESGKFE